MSTYDHWCRKNTVNCPLNTLWMVLKPHFHYIVCTKRFIECVESTLALLSVLHTLLYLHGGWCTPASWSVHWPLTYHCLSHQLTQATHHKQLIENCLEEDLIPEGLQINLERQAFMASMTDIKAQWDQKLTAMSKTLFKDARGTLPESCLWLSDQNLQNPESTPPTTFLSHTTRTADTQDHTQEDGGQPWQVPEVPGGKGTEEDQPPS